MVHMADMLARVRRRAERDLALEFGLRQISHDEAERFAEAVVEREVAFAYGGQVTVDNFGPEAADAMIEAAYEAVVLRHEREGSAIVVVVLREGGLFLHNLLPV